VVETLLAGAAVLGVVAFGVLAVSLDADAGHLALSAVAALVALTGTVVAPRRHAKGLAAASLVGSLVVVAEAGWYDVDELAGGWAVRGGRPPSRPVGDACQARPRVGSRRSRRLRRLGRRDRRPRARAPCAALVGARNVHRRSGPPGRGGMGTSRAASAEPRDDAVEPRPRGPSCRRARAHRRRLPVRHRGCRDRGRNGGRRSAVAR